MKRKRQGATFIVCVIIFAFVITVMTAMLSMVVGNYKARVVESKRLEHLYGAESGLDVAYNIIGQTFNAAVMYGNNQVGITFSENAVEDINNSNSVKYTNLKNDIDYWQTRAIPNGATSDQIKAFKLENRTNIMKDNEDIELLKNEEFKKAFNEFLYKENNNIIDETDNNTDELAKSIVGKQYVKDISKDKDNGRYEKVSFKKNSGDQDPTLLVFDDKNPTKSVADPTKTIDVNKDKGGIHYNIGARNAYKSIDRPLAVIGDSHQLIIDVHDNQEYIVKVTSNFETVSANGPNLRTVQATYTIKVPDYMQSIKDYKILDNRSLIVGKNMNLNDIDFLTVNGDVFVQGEIPTSEVGNTPDIAYDKYLGGIKIDKSKNVYFNKGDVITRSTFNIIDNVGVNLENNLYARNVYAGNGKDFASGSDIDRSTLKILKDLVVDNDLTLKANYTDIKIKNFYGINEDTNSNTNDTKKRNSSSIIVNKDKTGDDPFTSSINISDEAWIMGAAYINTAGKYATGESVGVKGNYDAYSVHVDSDSKDVSFSYDDPLYLINGTVFDKGQHFVDYWGETDRISNIDIGGIKLSDELSKIHSIGAIVFKNKDGIQLQGPKYHIENDTTISTMQQDYAAKVYKFGETATPDDYTNGEDYATNVSELVDFSNMDTKYSLKDQANKSEKAIFNKDDRKIIIKVANSGDDPIVVPDDITSPIIINAKDGKLDAVIATKGDIRIEGNVEFNGSIITNGSLDISGDNIEISYDSNVVNKVQAQNPDLFESVFKDGQYHIDTEGDDLSNYLASKLWKIIK